MRLALSPHAIKAVPTVVAIARWREGLARSAAARASRQLVRSLARDVAATVWPFARWRETWQVSGQGGELQATWLTGSLARAATDKPTCNQNCNQQRNHSCNRNRAHKCKDNCEQNLQPQLQLQPQPATTTTTTTAATVETTTATIATATTATSTRSLAAVRQDATQMHATERYYPHLRRSVAAVPHQLPPALNQRPLSECGASVQCFIGSLARCHGQAPLHNPYATRSDKMLLQSSCSCARRLLQYVKMPHKCMQRNVTTCNGAAQLLQCLISC